MTNSDPVETEIRRFIVDNFLFGREDGQLGPEDSFLEQGIVDSTGVLELVQFLETAYGFKVDDEELVPENLDTLRRVAAFVERKRAQNSE